ncbi:MAG: hypothetical protein AAB270_00060, partial [Chloroflexota bacterium]
HIRSLLLTFFYRKMRDLITQGHLYIAQPPLYRIAKGKTQEWLYSEEEMERSVTEKAFGDISVYSKDRAVTVTGRMIRDLLESLKEVTEGFSTLEQHGIPREVSAILLTKDDSFHRLDFSKQETMQEVRRWFEEFELRTRSSSDPAAKEYWVEVDLRDRPIRLGRAFFEHPALHRCFKAYPQIKHVVEGKSYIIAKSGKEIGKDIPWYELVDALHKTSDKAGIVIQRYKGLGEMSPQQLWETTMDPTDRTLLLVTIEDAQKADELFNKLMGDEVEPRRDYILAYARSVRNLDV